METVKTAQWWWLVGIIVIVGAAVLVLKTENPISFVIDMRHAISQEERFVLNEIDHKLVAHALRDFAESQHWKDLDVSAGDPRIPKEVQILKPSAIWLHGDHIELDFGGAFLSFGLRVFRPGVVGYGTKKLDEGVWFYSEDNRVPRE